MPPKATIFPHFHVALAGMGPLVCPLETLGDLLAKGELVEPWPHIRVAGPTYAAVYDAGSPERQIGANLRWLAARRSAAVVRE
ncbi:MAG TPA: hypothetical protein VGO70_10925 [Arsenicitalea sp.]|nr:hypothetical protein [Arsenicitalea sp.]